MMKHTHSGPRVLLRKLREVMAEPVSAQERLDRLVVLIAANMVAEVCSVYVLRGEGLLELYATEGLKREAVHLTNLKIGEGLVGTIAADAQPLALSDAQNHPAFVYRPETGEEIYASFLGVPVLRAGLTLGVLVVQNKAPREYQEEEIEALETVAIVLAEMIAGGELQALSRQGAQADPTRARSYQIEGLPIADGVGLGHVVLHEPRITVSNLVADDVEKELERLNAALSSLHSEIDEMLERAELLRGGDHKDILEAYRMFAADKGWAVKMRDAVKTGLTAEAAVERVQNDTRARLLRLTDPYLRERLHDLDDLTNRLLRVLTGATTSAASEALPDNAIIVARAMGPADLLDYNRERIRGLVLEEGGPTSHVAIVARALGLPCVSQVSGITSLVESHDAIIVDGLAGQVHLRPTADVEAAYAEKVRFRARRQAQYAKLRRLPAITQDGVSIKIYLNAGLLVDLPSLAESGADGIGLFRTELQFMVAARFPRIREQYELYNAVLDSVGEKPVTFRTLDIGGDKVLPYMRLNPEENPALGWRAIRLSLDRPGLMRSQMRALLRAASGRHLRLMYPMVTEISELDKAFDILEREKKYLVQHGHKLPSDIKIGAMLEVPSLLFQLDSLFSKVDFVSVGSNDLLQYLFAADRGNTELSTRFDPLSTPILRAFKAIADAAKAAGKPVTLCGELASKPLEAMALLAIGFRSISMSPASVGPVKAMTLALDLSELEAVVLPALQGEPRSLRPDLYAFAEAYGIPV